jgi:hypothetical protein
MIKIKLILLLNLNIFVSMKNNNIDEIMQQIESLLQNFEDSKDFQSNVYKNTKEFHKILYKNDFEYLHKVFPDLFNNILNRIETDEFREFSRYLEKVKELNKASKNIDFIQLNKKFVNLSKILFKKIEDSSPDKLNIFLTNINKLNKMNFNEQNMPIGESIIDNIKFEEYNSNICDVFFENVEMFNEYTKIINFQKFNENFPKLLNVFFHEINFNYMDNLKSSDSLFKNFGRNVILLDKLSEKIDFKEIYNLLNHTTDKYKEKKACRNMTGEERIYAFSKSICHNARNKTEENFKEYLEKIELFNNEAENFNFIKLKGGASQENIFFVGELLINHMDSQKYDDFKTYLEILKENYNTNEKIDTQN